MRGRKVHRLRNRRDGLLDELIAGSVEHYVAIATSLAADPARLATIRRELRPGMLRSPLMDSARFCRDFEQALRTMWRTWCGTGAGR